VICVILQSRRQLHILCRSDGYFVICHAENIQIGLGFVLYMTFLLIGLPYSLLLHDSVCRILEIFVRVLVISARQLSGVTLDSLRLSTRSCFGSISYNCC
jgi:hypothetical protein